MSQTQVLGLFAAPGRQDCLTAVSRAVLRIRSNGWTREALAKVLDCSPDTIDHASAGDDSMLGFVSIARLAHHFPDEFKLIEALWSCPPTQPPTLAERLDRVDRETAAIRREIGSADGNVVAMGGRAA